MHAISSALGIWAGVGLLRERRWGVVFRAMVVRWIIGPVLSAISNQVLPYLTFGNMGSGMDILVSLIWSTIVAVLWTAYLMKSKRVRATYIEGFKVALRDPKLSTE